MPLFPAQICELPSGARRCNTARVGRQSPSTPLKVTATPLTVDRRLATVIVRRSVPCDCAEGEGKTQCEKYGDKDAHEDDLHASQRRLFV